MKNRIIIMLFFVCVWLPVVAQIDTLVVSKNTDSLQFEKAVQTIRSYLQNDTLQRALRFVHKRVQKDSTALAVALLKKQNKFSFSAKQEVDSLLKEVEDNSSFQWLRKLQQDSILLTIFDGEGNIMRLWTNIPRVQAHRFWIHKNRQDSLGFWLHSVPVRGLMITPDFDISQKKKTGNHKSRIRGVPIHQNPEFFKLPPLPVYPKIFIPWNRGAVTSFDFSQAYFQHWVKGGQNAISMRSNIHLFANYKKEKWTWENYLTWKYGIIQSENVSEFVRNEDLLEINTKVGLKASKSWYYSSQFNLKTQLFDGYKDEKEKQTKVSTFLSPGYFSLALGMDYKPSKKFSLLLSPLTAKLIYIQDKDIDETTYGIGKGKHLWKQLGPYLKMRWDITLWKSVEMGNTVELFSNYIHNFTNVDIDWTTVITMQINYFMSAKITTQLLYDDDIAIPLFRNEGGNKVQIGTGKRVQFNENFSVGVIFRI